MLDFQTQRKRASVTIVLISKTSEKLDPEAIKSSVLGPKIYFPQNDQKCPIFHNSEERVRIWSLNGCLRIWLKYIHTGIMIKPREKKIQTTGFFFSRLFIWEAQMQNLQGISFSFFIGNKMHKTNNQLSFFGF